MTQKNRTSFMNDPLNSTKLVGGCGIKYSKFRQVSTQREKRGKQMEYYLKLLNWSKRRHQKDILKLSDF